VVLPRHILDDLFRPCAEVLAPSRGAVSDVARRGELYSANPGGTPRTIHAFFCHEAAVSQIRHETAIALCLTQGLSVPGLQRDAGARARASRGRPRPRTPRKTGETCHWPQRPRARTPAGRASKMPASREQKDPGYSRCSSAFSRCSFFSSIFCSRSRASFRHPSLESPSVSADFLYHLTASSMSCGTPWPPS